MEKQFGESGKIDDNRKGYRDSCEDFFNNIQ
jgi:hypothetical protein